MVAEIYEAVLDSGEEQPSPWDNDLIDIAKIDLETIRSEIASELLRAIENMGYVDYDYPAIFLGLYWQSARHIDAILGKLIGEGKLIRTERGWTVPRTKAE